MSHRADRNNTLSMPAAESSRIGPTAMELDMKNNEYKIARYMPNALWLAALALSLLLSVSCHSTLPADDELLAIPPLSSDLPRDIPGGAPNAQLPAAAQFAWHEFISLNWPAVEQNGRPGQRGTADKSVPFGGAPGRPLVWETLRSKVEIYPGQGQPPGYVNNPGTRYGFDALPEYRYSANKVGSYPNLPAGHIPPDVGQVPVARPAWVNLDEDNEIEEDAMFAGVVSDMDYPGPQFLYTAKANYEEYGYVAANGWWKKTSAASPPFNATADYVFENKTTPPPGSTTLVSLPNGTIELKSAWRRLLPAEVSSGRWHTAPVRYYVPQKTDQVYDGVRGNRKHPAYREEVFGLAALHIIHKTPSAPYFIYATFEHADNILTANGLPVEDAAGNIIRNKNLPPTEPVVVSVPAGPGVQQTLTAQGPFGDPGDRLYFKNLPAGVPAGPVSINRRVHSIPEEVIAANTFYQGAIALYEAANGVSSPWRNYKLVNVQWVPLDKPPGKPYTGANPASYYLSNSVVETDTNLQSFSGKLDNPRDTNGLITDYYNANNRTVSPNHQYPLGAAANNVSFNSHNYNMGGCMGCHGNIAALGADFSFILNGQSVLAPEFALEFGE
jgi:hypothetical protein